MTQDRVAQAMSDAQRLIIESYRTRPLARYVLFNMFDIEAARANIGTMIDRQWIQSSDRAFKRVDEQRDQDKELPIRVNLSFSMKGLTALGLDQQTLHNLPLAFTEGMAASDRARLLNDKPQDWAWSDQDERIHGMLLLFADGQFADQVTHANNAQTYDPDKLLDAAWNHLKESCVNDPAGPKRFGFDVVNNLPAGWLRDDLKGHFGFRDGISQPYLEGTETSRKPQGRFADVHTIKPGEILLGLQNESGSSVPPLWLEADTGAEQPWFDWLDSEGIGLNRKDFGRNGTYLAFRQMEQKVSEFDDFLNAQALNQMPAGAAIAPKSWLAGTNRPLNQILRFDQFLDDISQLQVNAVLRPVNEALLRNLSHLPEGVRGRIKYHWLDQNLTLLLLCQLSAQTCDYIAGTLNDLKLVKIKPVSGAKDVRDHSFRKIADLEPWKSKIDQLNKDLNVLGDYLPRLRSDAANQLGVGLSDDVRAIHDAFVQSALRNGIGLDVPAGNNDVVGDLSMVELLHVGLLPLVMKALQAFHNHKEKTAAKFIGRWRSGAPLVQSPDSDKPWMADENDFVYLPEDKHGFRCPIGAHVRRSNPRDALADERLRISADASLARTRRARIIRRGRPYVAGPYDVGIHFIALNASLRDQFEFILTNWINNSDFGELHNEVDPLMGIVRDSDASRDFTIQDAPLSKRYTGLNDFVQVRGGGYFFMPGVNALRFIARTPRPKQSIDPLVG